MPDLRLTKPTLTYREIYVLMGLWAKHLMSGDSSTGSSGIGEIDYSGLIKAGLVEYVDLNAGKDGLDQEYSLAQTAMRQIRASEFAAAIHSLQKIDELPRSQWVYRLTPKGIEHLKAQADAVPDQVNW